MGSQPSKKKADSASRNMDTLVQHILDKENCRNVFIMAGAGISTSAGIPDFRSPETGLYANLARLNLPYPEAVFDIGFFQGRPEPFYALAKELQPGKFRPTITHSFIRLLHDKGLLHTCFTQNIDTLERRAGVPAEKLIEAHGSFASHSCTKCKASYPDDKMQENVSSQRVPHCLKCKGLVKPDIVFFGESLPDSFIRGMGSLQDADLLIILGTSLTVHPFASLSHRVPSSCPRVLINLEEVGGIGSRSKDILLLGDCDTTVRELCKELRWLDELEALWNATESLVEGKDKATEEDATTLTAREPETKDEKLSREVDALTKEVEKTLKLSEDHLEEVSAELAAPSKTNSVTTENTTEDDDDNQETDTDTRKKSEDVDETPSKS